MGATTPTILLVEDEPDVCKALRSYFEKRGFLVSATGKGLEALSLIKASQPDIVILDMTLTDISGLETLKRLRVYDQKTKVIVVTGHVCFEKEEKALTGLGVSGFYRKPLALQEIEKIVARVSANKALPPSLAPLAQNHTGENFIQDDISHRLTNLLGVIRNTCENFTLDIQDGLYRKKSDKEIIDEALHVMTEVVRAVDKAVQALRDIKDEKPKNL